jgi:hypothetical protein
MLTGTQIREARTLLGWSVLKLGNRAKLHTSTIHRAECVDGEPPITEAHGAATRFALERAGIEFINGDEPGVKLIPMGKNGDEARARTGRGRNIIAQHRWCRV